MDEEICDGNLPLVNKNTGRDYDCENGKEKCPAGSYCHRVKGMAKCCKGSHGHYVTIFVFFFVQFYEFLFILYCNLLLVL